MRHYLLACMALALFVAVGLTACGPTQTTASATQTAAAQTQTVTVVLTDTNLTATPTTFRPGVRCHFVVTNHGTVPHEFLIMPPGMAQMMGRMPMAQWHQQALHATGMLGPGMMTTFDYTFSSMPMMAQGQYAAFGCYAAGYPLMHVPIMVQP